MRTHNEIAQRSDVSKGKQSVIRSLNFPGNGKVKTYILLFKTKIFTIISRMMPKI